MEFTVEDDNDSNIYLIIEDFIDIEPIIEQNFKKIFKNELSMIIYWTAYKFVWREACQFFKSNKKWAIR